MVTTYVAIFICAIAASFWSISDQAQIGWLQDFVQSHGWTRLLRHKTPSVPAGAR